MKKMKVELDKKGLINLVLGSSPSYRMMEDTVVNRCGNFNGSYGTWSWIGSKLEELSETQLYKLYKKVSNNVIEDIIIDKKSLISYEPIDEKDTLEYDIYKLKSAIGGVVKKK